MGKLSVSSRRGQPDLVINFFDAEEPALSVCQIGPAASCGRLGVFRAPVLDLQSASSVGHTQNGRNTLSRGANGSNWHQTLNNWSPYSGQRLTP